MQKLEGNPKDRCIWVDGMRRESTNELEVEDDDDENNQDKNDGSRDDTLLVHPRGEGG